MRADGWKAVLLLLAALGWHGPAVGAEGSSVQDRKSADDRLPMSTRCTAKCDELVKQCEEHERLHPSCSVVNICFEEKLLCEALCRARAMWIGRVCS